jgi:hypothetical protein
LAPSRRHEFRPAETEIFTPFTPLKAGRQREGERERERKREREREKRRFAHTGGREAP